MWILHVDPTFRFYIQILHVEPTFRSYMQNIHAKPTCRSQSHTHNLGSNLSSLDYERSRWVRLPTWRRSFGELRKEHVRSRFFSLKTTMNFSFRIVSDHQILMLHNFKLLIWADQMFWASAAELQSLKQLQGLSKVPEHLWQASLASIYG